MANVRHVSRSTDYFSEIRAFTSYDRLYPPTVGGLLRRHHIHASKGLEADCVLVFPAYSHAQLDRYTANAATAAEERRAFYVSRSLALSGKAPPIGDWRLAAGRRPPPNSTPLIAMVNVVGRVVIQLEIPMTTIQTRDRTETETAASENAETVAALGKRVIHVGGRPATDDLFELGRFEPNQYVLDAGCGVGATAIQIASRYGSQVTAIDISPTMVERATVNAQAAGLEDRVTVQQGDILDLDFPDDTFDRVVIEAVSMFVDRDQATRELVRVCKPGGYVVDHEAYFSRTPTDGIIESSQHLFPGLELDETPDVWADRYRSAGLTDIEYVTGPVRFLGPRALIRDEGLSGSLKMMGRLLTKPKYLQRMRDVAPHERRVEPYLDYFVLAGRKPA